MKEAKKHAAGDLDPVFGESGIKQIAQHHTSFFQAHGLALSGEGKLLIAGSHRNVSGSYTYFSLDRRTDLGDPDQTFGDCGFVDGRFTSDASLSSMGIKIFAKDSTRLLLFGMFTNSNGAFLPAFARLLTNGQLDADFGDQGSCVVRSPLIPDFGSFHDPYLDACIQSTKHILCIHPHVLSPNKLTTLILRIDENGTFDNGFNEGKAYVDARRPGSERTRLTAIAAQTDDKILVCGYTDDVHGIKAGILLRYKEDGQKDYKFATAGAFSRQDWRFEHLVVLDDRILCCGSTASGEALLVQFDTEGNLQGEPSITPANISARWTKMAWMENKIVLTGVSQDEFGSQLVVARINDDRTLDRSFGKGGFVTIDFGEQFSVPVDFTHDDNRKIVVLASVKDLTGTEKFFLARLFN